MVIPANDERREFSDAGVGWNEWAPRRLLQTRACSHSLLTLGPVATSDAMVGHADSALPCPAVEDATGKQGPFYTFSLV